MKTLLISLQKDLETIGLKYLHYYLLNNGYNSNMFYLPSLSTKNNSDLLKIKDFVLKINPDIVGISLMSTEYLKALSLTKFLKESIKSTPIIWGGIHPTIAPEDCLDYADFVCIGEGEKTILDIVRSIEENKPIKNVKNLCYKESGIVKKNPLYPFITDLDTIPPYQHLPKNTFILNKHNIIPLDKRNFKRYSRYSGKTYSIISTRGCPFHCTYCCNSFSSKLYKNNTIRRRGIVNIIEDIHQAVTEHKDIEYINFQDDCFLAVSENYLKDFCASYKNTINRPFIIRSIPTYVTREKIGLLKDAGLS